MEAQTGRRHSLEERPLVPSLGFLGKAGISRQGGRRLVWYSHCGIPSLSPWFSSTWSHPHWAGTGRSGPEAAGVWDQSLSLLRKWVSSLTHTAAAFQRPLLMGEELPIPLGTRAQNTGALKEGRSLSHTHKKTACNSEELSHACSCLSRENPRTSRTLLFPSESPVS